MELSLYQLKLIFLLSQTGFSMPATKSFFGFTFLRVPKMPSESFRPEFHHIDEFNARAAGSKFMLA